MYPDRRSQDRVSLAFRLETEDQENVRLINEALVLLAPLGRDALRFFREANKAFFWLRADEELTTNKKDQILPAPSMEIMAHGNIESYLQAKVDAKTHQVTSFEALAQITTKNGDYVNPETFAKSLNEQQSKAFDLIMIEETLARMAEIDSIPSNIDGKGTPMRIAVNISPGSLSTPGFAEYVKDLASYYEVPINRLRLEIVERGHIASRLTDIGDNIGKLASYGVRMSIDDFMMGDSRPEDAPLLKSLGVGVDELKLDAALIRGAFDIESPEDMNYCRDAIRRICSLAHEMGMKVVAEGVRDRYDGNEVFPDLSQSIKIGGFNGLSPEQRNAAEEQRLINARTDASFLSNLGVDLIQGYSFSIKKNFDTAVRTEMFAAESENSLAYLSGSKIDFRNNISQRRLQLAQQNPSDPIFEPPVSVMRFSL